MSFALLIDILKQLFRRFQYNIMIKLRTKWPSLTLLFYYTSQNLIRATQCKFPLQNIQFSCKT